MSPEAPTCTRSIADLLHLLPHRAPFLLLDAVSEFEAGVRVVALKSVTANEWFFPPNCPDAVSMTMPGLLVVEAMAQAGAVLLMAGASDADSTVVYFAALDHVQWHAPVVPGDQLELRVRVTHARGRLRKVHAEAVVRGSLVCEADLSAVTMDRDAT